MANEQEALTRLAEAVADRKPVDWRSETDTPVGVKRQLQFIEALGALHEVPADLDTESSDADIGRLPTEIRPVSDGLLRTWGHLRIVERIGRGGFGDVYRAYDPQLDREVALKLLRPEMSGDETNCRRFIQEARRQARVSHPNVVVVHGVDRHDGRVGLWMELVKGKTLEERLKEHGPCSPEEAALIGIEVCRALAAVHNAGFIHRDVKTSNVMRQEGGKIVLMDFSAVSERVVLEHRPPGGSISGTPVFMAPEVLEGENAGVASDIYSLGVLIYRLVTGSFPVEANRFAALREKHRQRASKPLRDARADLPAAFVQAVDRALSPDVSERYSSVGELERALASLGGAARHREDAAGGAIAVSEGRTWWPGKAWLALALVVVIAGLWILWPRSLWVDGSLFRLREGVREQLTGGGQLRPGDELFLKIKGSAGMYVYVFNEDQRGDVFVLFPMDGLDSQNPLRANVEHQLPGAVKGRPFHWEVTSAGQRERFMMIASRKPLPDLERTIRGLPTAQIGKPVEIATKDLLPLLRGIGGLKQAQSSADSQLSATFDALAAQVSGQSGLWAWRMDLANPTHSGEPGQAKEPD